MPIRGYTLALSWSPEHCAKRGRADGFQCRRGRGTNFGFVLHGLWPNGPGNSWPQYCRPAERLPPAVLRANLCATPSVDLLQHEWAKHGTCMSRQPGAYFDQARGLYGRLRFPNMELLARDGRLTVDGFRQALVAANARAVPALPRLSVQVRLTRDGWLEEVLICFDRRMKYARCAPQSGVAAPERRLRIRLKN